MLPSKSPMKTVHLFLLCASVSGPHWPVANLIGSKLPLKNNADPLDNMLARALGTFISFPPSSFHEAITIIIILMNRLNQFLGLLQLAVYSR